MNALVDDQLDPPAQGAGQRRRSCMAAASTAMGTGSTSAATPEPRLSPASATTTWRYVSFGATYVRPRPGEHGRASSARSPARRMRSTSSRGSTARRCARAGTCPPRPPDVLITNYSMLNVMLLRERDGHFFDSHAELAGGRSRASVHARRRRAAHVPRHRPAQKSPISSAHSKPGWDWIRRPDQLRILAASASLEPARDRAYLQDFFGVDGESFEFIGGET